MKKNIVLSVLLVSLLATITFAQNADESYRSGSTMSQHPMSGDVDYGRDYRGRDRSTRRGYGGSCCY